MLLAWAQVGLLWHCPKPHTCQQSQLLSAPLSLFAFFFCPSFTFPPSFCLSLDKWAACCMYALSLFLGVMHPLWYVTWSPWNLSFCYILFHELTHFLILAGSAFLPNMIRAVPALIIFGKIHLLVTSENEFFHGIKPDRTTSFMDFMTAFWQPDPDLI